MNTHASRTPARTSLPPPVNLCTCKGCRRHVARLEDLNAQLARENDRLRREVEAARRIA